MSVLARTYTLETAAKRLQLPGSAIAEAVRNKALVAFTDPEGKTRIPAVAVEAAVLEQEKWEQLAGYTPIQARQISQVAGIAHSAVRSRLKKAGLSLTDPAWKDIRGRWGLPDNLKNFQAIQQERFPTRGRSLRAGKDRVERQSWSAARSVPDRPRRGRGELRQKLLDVFPTWDSELRPFQHATLHIGPTNSGKTFQALNELVNAGSGWYLSPLRLLAYEVFDTLNKRGVACSLLTGEESIPVEGAAITAATIEMFDPGRSGSCVIIDEAHMLTDSQRGWAWTRAIMETRSPDIHIIGAPFIEPLVMRLVEAAGIRVDRVEHERLTPLQVLETPWSLTSLPPRTILVAFSRAMVLGLKTELERDRKRGVSVVYGNLPPEVRLNQAERFARGQTEICVATDAVGMGLNLPADNVCFFETDKFDGHTRRSLTPNEIRQIGGRAGRFGLSDFGQVGALTRGDLAVVRQAIDNPIMEYSFAYVAPTPQALKLIPGTLAGKLSTWMLLQDIPAKWKMILRPVDLSAQIELANLLSPQDVDRLGEERAFKLINAPTYRETENYWLLCARAIIHGKRMAAPQAPGPKVIQDANDLILFEQAIRSADCYLWLSQREEFFACGPESESVRARRAQWSVEVDAALQRRVDTARRCRLCGRPLPLKHRYNICQHCFRDRPAWNEERW
jgi:ATP-dependent RNA helicase SUPV3L1/SUV3